MISPEQKAQTGLSRAPSRYRRNRSGNSNVSSTPGGLGSSSGTLNNPFLQPGSTIPATILESETTTSTSADTMPTLVPESKPKNQPLPPPPPAPSAAVGAALVKPISLGYQKVYHKDSALLPVEMTQLPDNSNPFAQAESSSNPNKSPADHQAKSSLLSFNSNNNVKNNDNSINSSEQSSGNPFLSQHESPDYAPANSRHNNTFGPALDASISLEPSNKTQPQSNEVSPNQNNHKSSPFSALQQKIKRSTSKLETNSRVLSSQVAKPAKGMSLDEIHARHAQNKANSDTSNNINKHSINGSSNSNNSNVLLKFVYPEGITDQNGSTSFVASLSLDQTCRNLIKTVLIRQKQVLNSNLDSQYNSDIDPNDYVLCEVCPSLGLRRVIRPLESIRHVYESWSSVNSNYFQIDLATAVNNNLVSRPELISSSGPSGPSFHARCQYLVSAPKSWKKVQVVFGNGTLTISRKSPGEILGHSKDKKTIAHIKQISQFDVYEVMDKNVLASSPGRYLMAIRSQQCADIFADMKDCMHIIAMEDSRDYNSLRSIVYTIRDEACIDKSKTNEKEQLGDLPKQMEGLRFNTPDLKHPRPTNAFLINDPFISPNSSRSSSPVNNGYSNQKLLARQNTVTRSRQVRSRSNSSTSPVRQHSPTQKGSPSRHDLSRHETLIMQQQQRKAALAQQGLQAPLPTMQHSRPTLIDSISAPTQHSNNNFSSHPYHSNNNSNSSSNSNNNTQRHGFKGLVASIGHLGSSHNNSDYYDGGSNMSASSKMQYQDMANGGSGNVFKPDSLLGQMAHGSNTPSVAATAAAAGIYRQGNDERNNGRDREGGSSNGGGSGSHGLSRSGTTASRTVNSNNYRLGRRLTVSGSGGSSRT